MGNILLVIIVLIVMLVLWPMWRKRLNGPKYVSELSYLVGEKGWVVSSVAVDKTGMVRVGTDIWSARAAFGSDALEPGQWVDITEAKKDILIVKAKPM
ncbi:MAG: NfeD family protein [Firmicutes bacterium]|nr:NfeD family protein [Bacillota bacterium]